MFWHGDTMDLFGDEMGAPRNVKETFNDLNMGRKLVCCATSSTGSFLRECGIQHTVV
jgi:hypothetical protein